MDFPLSNDLFPFLDRLDELVVAQGGRVYLAKDARMRPEIFRTMYTRFPDWSHTKIEVDPQNRFDSDLAQRLELTSKATK
jgi:hypothetical protein